MSAQAQQTQAGQDPTFPYRVLRGSIGRREGAAAHRAAVAATGDKINAQYCNGDVHIYRSWSEDVIQLTRAQAAAYGDRVEPINARTKRLPPSMETVPVWPPIDPGAIALNKPPPAKPKSALATDDTEDDSESYGATLSSLSAPAAIELINGLETIEELHEVRAAESSNMNRKAVLDAIDARMPDGEEVE